MTVDELALSLHATLHEGERYGVGSLSWADLCHNAPNWAGRYTRLAASLMVLCPALADVEAPAEPTLPDPAMGPGGAVPAAARAADQRSAAS